MKLFKTCFKDKYEICIYSILLLAALLPGLLAVKNIKLATDSMIYALISQEILSGNGIKLPIIMNLSDNHVFIDGAIPHLEEPPLLPMLFAILGGVTPQNFFAAQTINLISHVVISIFTFLLMKKLYDNKVIALLTGMLVSVAYPLLYDANHILSEPLFTAITAAALYFLILSRDPVSRPSTRNFLVASICISAAILTKYAGVALIPVFFWGAFILIKNKHLKLKYIPTILAIILPMITIGVLFIRNLLISGTIQGWDPPPPERSYFSALAGTVKMIFLQFYLGELAVILISLFVTVCIFYIIVNSGVRRELLKYLHSGLDLIILFISSLTVLISLAMAKSQTVFELRFAHPLVPFLFILCTFIIVFVWEMIRLKGFSKFALYGIILSLGIITFGNCYKTYLQSGDFFREDGKQYFVPNSLTFKWIKENYGEDVIITTNKSFPLSFFGGYSTVQLPHKRFQENFRIPENMESILPHRMSKFGSRVLALFGVVDEQHEGNYLARLFNKRKDDDNFVLIHSFSDGVVYKLKD